MVKIFDKHKQPQTQNREAFKENRRVVIPILIVVSIFIMACPLAGPETVDFEKIKSIYSNATEEAAQLLNPEQTDPTPEQSVSKQEPISQSRKLQESESETKNVGTNEFAVTATNFSCECSVDGNVTQALNIKDNQLEIIDPDGNARVYEKIGENAYKTSWMGYYILMIDGQETQVDEERSVVIILTDTGYLMEHYQGSEGSPCCIHTFSQTK